MEFVSGNSVESATTGLMNLLGGIIEAVANFFGVTVSFVKENFWDYILMFGRYRLGTKIITCAIILSVLMTIIIAVISFIRFAVKYRLDREEYVDDSDGKATLNLLSGFNKIAICVCLIIFVCYAGYQIVRYAISPELYAIDVTIQYINFAFGGS